MDRRQFCQSTLAASVAAHYALLAGCQRDTPVASSADASLPAIKLDGSEFHIERAVVREFGEAFDGTVLLSSHPQYDSTRRIWNGMHDKRPAMIAQVANTADVQKAVNFARDNGLLLAVRGGGHSWPGKSTCDGGMMLDLSQLNGVTVDAQLRRANAGGGALLNTLDSASLEHGLVTTAGVVSHTGVGGLTLGGGFGRLNRKFGLTIDNLLSAEVVTADGQVRQASADNEAELYWALRGGGGNFGVVTNFEYQLHPFDRTVLSGMVVWPIDQATEVLNFYSDWYRELSDELYVGPAMMTLPDGTGIIAMEVVYAGDPQQGEAEMAPLRAVGKPLEDGIKMQDYMVMQTQEDAAFGHGIRSYAKNGMVRELSREMVDAMIDAYRPDPRLAVFTHTAGGAVKRVAESATAFPHRNAETMIIVAGGWTSPEDDDDAIRIAREWFYELEPFTGGYYDNIDYERAQGAARNYGPNYERLRAIKGRYDPGNLFRLNSNIEPATI